MEVSFREVKTLQFFLSLELIIWFFTSRITVEVHSTFIQIFLDRLVRQKTYKEDSFQKALEIKEPVTRYKALWTEIENKNLPFSLDLYGNNRVSKRASKKRKLEEDSGTAETRSN